MKIIYFIQFLIIGHAQPTAKIVNGEPVTFLVQQEQNQYCNARFDYCIDYPSSLTPRPESENGDGRIFVNQKGIECLRVWGSLNGDAEGNPQSLEEKLNEMKAAKKSEGYSITYQSLNKNYFILTGKKQDKLFYQKTILKEDAFATAIAKGDRPGKEDFKVLSELVFKSFR